MSSHSIKLSDVLKNRWTVFAAASWLESCSGMSYMYGQYSQLFKTELGYNQKMVDVLGMAKDLGGNVGITSGFCGDYFPTWVVLLVGSFQNFFGYFILWLIITRRISPLPFWLMSIVMCVGSNGATFFNTAGLVTCVKNFPYSRGPVVGLLKGFIGLSGAIFTQIYLSLYYPNSKSILLMVAWMPSVISILVIPAIHSLPVIKEEDEQSKFKLVLITSISTALTLLGTNILQEMTTVSRYFSLFISLLTFAILSIPLGIAMIQEIEKKHGTNGTVAVRSDAVSQSVKSPTNKLVDSAHSRLFKRSSSLNGTGKERNELLEEEKLLFVPPKERSQSLKDENENVNELKTKRGEDHTLTQAIQTKDFWLLYLAMTLASGSGLTAINNLGQVGNSLGHNERAINVLVSLVSIWNFLGRVLGGYLGEYFVLRLGYPRPLLMVLSQLVMAMGHVMFATAFPGSLYPASMLVGLNYGAQWGLMPAIASEIFGLKYFSTMYNWLTIANPTGSYILSVCVAGYLYDMEAAKQAHSGLNGDSSSYLAPGSDSESPLLCSGPVCFRLTFFIMSLACLVASALSAWLTILTRPYYSAEFVKRNLVDDHDDESGVH